MDINKVNIGDYPGTNVSECMICKSRKIFQWQWIYGRFELPNGGNGLFIVSWGYIAPIFAEFA